MQFEQALTHMKNGCPMRLEGHVYAFGFDDWGRQTVLVSSVERPDWTPFEAQGFSLNEVLSDKWETAN